MLSINYSGTGTFFIIKKYAEIIPDFLLFFTFAKHNRIFEYVYPYYKEDVFQIIAFACLSEGDLKKRNLLLQRELYYFYRHVISSYSFSYIKKIFNRQLPFDKADKREKKRRKKYKKNSPNYFNCCDICGESKKEYMFKSFFPGKTVCRNCRRQHIRKYINPNYGRNKEKK
jgi:hypothetical protein